MEMIFKNILAIICLCAAILLTACTGNSQVEEYDPNKSYWPINQFMIDQYNQRKGSLHAIKKTVNLNGTIDSTFLKFDEVDWATIFKIFGQTDISNPSFYGQYNYNNFDDNFLEMSTMSYIAKDPKLYVQRLNVNYDNENGRIDMVYIETMDDGLINVKAQKLSYYVGKKIIIQESEKSKFSKDKELIVTYEFR